jgi:hypothetical protein
MTILWRRYRQVFRPNYNHAKLADCLCRYTNVCVHLDRHLSGQPTKRELERSDAFGFVSHEGSLSDSECGKEFFVLD